MTAPEDGSSELELPFMAGRPLEQIVDPGWAAALQPVAGQIRAMGDFLRAEVAAGRGYLPAGDRVLRAFQQPLADVRVRAGCRPRRDCRRAC